MAKKKYYLETEPQSWSGVRQLHADGCSLMPTQTAVKPIGSFTKAISAMMQARKIHRRAGSCICCKA